VTRNGPGKFEVGKTQILHPFDCDGLISAITLKDGEAMFRNSFVRTKGFVAERRYRKVLYRGIFGNQRKSGLLGNLFDTKMKNLANTNVIYWAGRLLALWEAGIPYKLEPDCLRTEGTYTFKGALDKSDAFAAHPRIDANTNRLVGFVTSQGSNSAVKFLEFDQDLKVVANRETKVPGGLMFSHDCVVTKNYYIVTNPPAAMESLDFIMGKV
jgi:all-trans-8'-apo-beta-carotenal 15,15'-oxygenase